MSNVKISELTAIPSALDGSEEFPLVQGSSTYKATINDVADFISGGGAGSSIVTTKVSLTSADILNFNGSNYFELVPAQGAGTYISVLKAFYVFNFVTTAYTGGGTIWITMGGLVANITTAVSNCFNQANTVLIRPPMYNSSLITNIYEDTSLELGCSAIQTLGDGTFDVHITYEVINL